MATFKEFMRVAQMTVNDKTSAKRMEQILSIMRKYHVTKGLTPEKAVQILQELGPTYVKIGQMASSRSDLLPIEYCKAFEQLHAQVSPLPFDTVIDCIEEAYGGPWQTVFSSIDEKPLGSASIAQVHKATLHDGSVVAVKVRRPGVCEQMAEDITLIKHLLALAEFSITSQESMLLNLDNLVAELERTTANELDFNVELHNLVRFHAELNAPETFDVGSSTPVKLHAEFYHDDGITCPVPYPQYSNESVLVMQFVQGIELDQKQKLVDAGVDLSKLGNRIVQNYAAQVLDFGFFHADPHPGNIIVCGQEIIWIDLGMTGSLNAGERALLSQMFHAVVTKNPYELKDSLLALSTSHGEVDHGQLLAKMSMLLNKYVQADLKDINVGIVFEEVIEVLRKHEVILAPSVTMLARGIVTLEGVLADIAPDTSIMGIVSKHVLKQEITPQNVEGKLIDLLTSSAESVQAVTRIPVQVSNTMEMLDRGEIKIVGDMRVPDNLMSALYIICGRIALALISMGLFLGSSILCTTNMEPKFLEVPILGVLGYLGAFVLGVYVIWRTFVSAHQKRNNLEPK